jgi:hypothetical protein
LKADEPPAVMPSRNTLPAQLERCGSDRFLRQFAVHPPSIKTPMRNFPCFGLDFVSIDI